MPIFKFHLRHRNRVEPDEDGLECPDVHGAYLQAFAAIPDVARDMLMSGKDPLEGAYVICDAGGRTLMTVPFTEVLSPAEWRLRHAQRRPYGGNRSEQARDELALRSFRRMFGASNFACVLLSPELLVTEITDFGARQSHVDADAVRGASILEIFDLTGAPKRNFHDFWMLARAGAVSEIVDLPYYVLDEHGQTANGWWKSRAWPIFDDDDNMLAIVEWAEPFIRPTADGATLVRVAPGSAA